MKWNQEKKYDLEESWIQTSEYVKSIWSKIRKLNSKKDNARKWTPRNVKSKKNNGW